MTQAFRPNDELELSEIVRSLAITKRPVAVVGGGTKSSIGRPINVEASLSTSGLTGITLYEPSELVIGARAGTPLLEVEKTLDGFGQRLAFEPMDYAPFFGGSGERTVGGIAAANVSGPRRIAAGACRDSLIGVRLVNGDGEIVKSGGRVMKNVTGLDLVKLVCGSWGTLGVFSEVVFKVLPKSERSSSLIIDDLAEDNAISALSAVLGSPFEVSGAAHIPKTIATPALTVVRIEGFDASVTYRLKQTAKLLEQFGDCRTLDEIASTDLWLSIRDARWLTTPTDTAIWRLSLAPSKAVGVVAKIRQQIESRYLYDWGGGLVWLSVEPSSDCGARIIRDALRGQSGHATLVRAPDTIKAVVEVHQPLPPRLLNLTAEIKAGFDPHGIFNPGRMYAGI